MILDLPWPHKDLSPNARVHWRRRAELVAKARDEAYWRALEVPAYERKPLSDAQALKLTLIFFNPAGRVRTDQDNALARCKAALDGIFRALRSDDSRIRETTICIGDATPGGCVRIKLEAM